MPPHRHLRRPPNTDPPGGRVTLPTGPLPHSHRGASSGLASENGSRLHSVYENPLSTVSFGAQNFNSFDPPYGARSYEVPASQGRFSRTEQYRRDTQRSGRSFEARASSERRHGGRAREGRSEDESDPSDREYKRRRALLEKQQNVYQEEIHYLDLLLEDERDKRQRSLLEKQQKVCQEKIAYLNLVLKDERDKRSRRTEKKGKIVESPSNTSSKESSSEPRRSSRKVVDKKRADRKSNANRSTVAKPKTATRRRGKEREPSCSDSDSDSESLVPPRRRKVEAKRPVTKRHDRKPREISEDEDSSESASKSASSTPPPRRRANMTKHATHTNGRTPKQKIGHSRFDARRSTTEHSKVTKSILPSSKTAHRRKPKDEHNSGARMPPPHRERRMENRPTTSHMERRLKQKNKENDSYESDSRRSPPSMRRRRLRTNLSIESDEEEESHEFCSRTLHLRQRSGPSSLSRERIVRSVGETLENGSDDSMAGKTAFAEARAAAFLEQLGKDISTAQSQNQ